MNSAAKIAAYGALLGMGAAGCGTGTTVIALVAPTISQVSPQVVTAGTPSVTVTVQGSNFQSNASVTVDGNPMPTTVVNSTTLAAQISGSPLAQPAVAHVQVKNTNGAASNDVPLTVTSAPQTPASLAVGTSGLPGAQSGTAYSAALSASGGTPGYAWALTSGSLPAGLSLSASGLISGTPNGSGTSTFSLTVSDSGSPAQTQTVTLSIAVLPATAAPPALSVTTASLGSGQVGSGYSASLGATGGTPGYTWTVSSGSLPAGLTLSSAGAISGTPTSPGNSNFTVTVTDSGSPAQTASVQESVLVKPSQLSIASGALVAGKSGTSYSASLGATGGTPGYTWALVSGSLPAGLTLSSTGVISGTPTASGNATFTVGVTDSGSPAQTASVQETINVTVAALGITTSSLPSGQNGSSYTASLGASGGLPAYTWTLISGALPAGLSLSSTGAISGTPTASGNASFTVQVADTESPAASLTASFSITVNAALPPNPGTTWYIRPDGGTRYSSNVQTGQCDGKADVPYPGSGVDQHCAFNDFRYMWDDDSGMVGAGQWVMAGGDTVIIRGCAALPGQTNASNPNCRIGWDGPTGPTSDNWCYGVGSYTCYNPPIPAGTATQHTRILGQNYASCNSGGATNPKQYASNLTQIFGGYGLTDVFNLQNTQYVDIQCIELTTHNGVCNYGTGAPAYPRGCNSSQPVDDYAQNGFLLNSQSSNVTFEDVYAHGFNSSGFAGPIGGAISMTRVFSGFNAFSGWNFDDGNDTPDAAGSSITASYVTMIGNGCYEEYPIVHTQYPARACYDTNSAGFGDAWSGQDTELDSFVCDHCVMEYNVKDAFIGPHTQIKSLSITNSVSLGNMGAQWKWGAALNSTVVFENNLTVTNCWRMTEALPGAAQNFNQSTGLGGSYLTNFCRAAGDGFAFITRSGSTNLFANNTVVSANATVIDTNCGYYTQGNVFNPESNCGAVPIVWENNNFLGYNDPITGALPGLYYAENSSIHFTGINNNEYGIRDGDSCGGTITCSDPQMVSEPAEPWPGSEAALDVFNPALAGNSFYPTASSPLVKAGAVIAGMTADFFGVQRPSPPSIGAVEP